MRVPGVGTIEGARGSVVHTPGIHACAHELISIRAPEVKAVPVLSIAPAEPAGALTTVLPLERIAHLIVDFVATGTDTRTDRGNEIAGLDASVRQRVDGGHH